MDEKMLVSLKRQIYDLFVGLLPTMTFGYQKWSLPKALAQRLRTAQKAMERKMLDIKIQDKTPSKDLRKQTG